jgi:radical SAM protein with 4Fe4S-binding SPASM domain
MAQNENITIHHNFFFLSDGWVIVQGAAHSLLVNPTVGRSFQINDTARKIIELGEQGHTFSAAIKELQPDLTLSETTRLITSLSDEGVINLSLKPMSPKTEVKDASSPSMGQIWIEVTPHCNLRCIHCYADGNGHQKRSMNTQKISQVIDEAAELGWKRLSFTGGECTLRPDLQELILHAKTEGFDFIEVFTNGTLIDEPMARFFAEEGIHVGVSLYSYRAEKHDMITGIPGSHAKTLDALTLLLAYEVPLRCEMVAMKQNEEDLDGTIYFLLKLGIPCREPDPIRPAGRGISLDNWPKKYGLTGIRTQPNFRIDAESFWKKQHWNSCWHGKICVTSSGDVIPCPFARDQIAGNISTHSLSEIVSGKEMQKYWGLTIDMIEPCRQCEFRYVCDDCRPWAYGFSGDLYAKSPRCTYDPLTGRWGKAKKAFNKGAVHGSKTHGRKQGCQES